MKYRRVRLLKIEIRNIKNVKFGVIEMPSNLSKEYSTNQGDLLGIYGQNGSGKTAVVEAMAIVKTLMSGQSLDPSISKLITVGEDTAVITTTYHVTHKEQQAFVEYSCTIQRAEANDISIYKESLQYKILREEGEERRSTLVDYTRGGKKFKPNYRYEEIANTAEKKNDLNLMFRMAEKLNTSYIFNSSEYNLFLNSDNDIYNLINVSLLKYAKANLFVLPMAYRLKEDVSIETGEYNVSINTSNVIDRKTFVNVNENIQQISTILSQIIPGLTIHSQKLNEVLMEDGEQGIRYELYSKRKDLQIPLKYESEGIIKLISILSLLISVFNNSSICLVIDEFDVSIHEYLLGELLRVFKEDAKGQFIFTSHNLRPLELLGYKNIVFSTTNENNQFIRLKHVKTTHNLRDQYYRIIQLGGQEEELAKEVRMTSIARAFRESIKE